MPWNLRSATVDLLYEQSLTLAVNLSNRLQTSLILQLATYHRSPIASRDCHLTREGAWTFSLSLLAPVDSTLALY